MKHPLAQAVIDLQKIYEDVADWIESLISLPFNESIFRQMFQLLFFLWQYGNGDWKIRRRALESINADLSQSKPGNDSFKKLEKDFRRSIMCQEFRHIGEIL